MIEWDVQLRYAHQRQRWFVSRSTLPGMILSEAATEEELRNNVFARARELAGAADYKVTIFARQSAQLPRWLRRFVSAHRDWRSEESRTTTVMED